VWFQEYNHGSKNILVVLHMEKAFFGRLDKNLDILSIQTQFLIRKMHDEDETEAYTMN
jgi:hypothetical protein